MFEGVVLGLGCRPAGDSSSACEGYRHDHTEDETTDMGEECNTTATCGIWAAQPEAGFEQLEQKPEAKKAPCRDDERSPTG